MSKLYDKFVRLKAANNDNVYLFKSGIFYLALNEDASKLADIFNFKVTYLNDSVTNCGFPEKRLEYYSSLLNKLNIDFEIVDSESKKNTTVVNNIADSNFNTIIDKLLKIDFDNITFRQAFDILFDISNEAKSIVDTSRLS